TAVTSVTAAGIVLVEGTDFEWSSGGMLERLGGCGWPRRYRSVTVVYDHGFDPIPEGIQEVVIDQARSIAEVLPGVQSMQAGGESVTYGAAASVGVTSQWTKAVTRYRINRGDRA
ncbi:mobile element protein, partial [Embleya sp. NPDC001921]